MNPRPLLAAGAVGVAVALALLVGIGMPSPAHAQSLEERFEAANGAFWDEDYGGAIQGYRELHEDFGVDNAVLWYDLGNAYARAGRHGRAVHAYRRALRFEPGAELGTDIEANLALVREELVERYRKELPQEQFVFTEAHTLGYTVFHLLSGAAAKWLFAATWILFFGWLAFLRYRGARALGSDAAASTAKRDGALSWGLGALAVLSAVLYFGHLSTEASTRLGVVVSRSAELREGRSDQAPKHPLPEGLEVRIIDELDPSVEGPEWLRVELTNGRAGWVSTQDLAPI